MRYIRWVWGVCLVSVAVAGLWLSSGHAGDVVLPVQQTKVLTGAQKTALVNSLKCDYPALVASSVYAVRCQLSRAYTDGDGVFHAEKLGCSLSSDKTYTAIEYSLARRAGTVGYYNRGSWNGSTLTASETSEIIVSDACKIQYDNFVLAVTGYGLDVTTGFEAVRHAGTPSQIDVTWRGIERKTAVEWINAGGGLEGEKNPVGYIVE